VVSIKLRPLYPQIKSPWYTLNRTPEPVWMRWQRKNFCPNRESHPGHPSLSVITILTELSQLLPSFWIHNLIIYSIYEVSCWDSRCGTCHVFSLRRSTRAGKDWLTDCVLSTNEEDATQMSGRNAWSWTIYFSFRDTLSFGVLCCLVDALYQQLHVYLLRNNSIVLTDCVMVMVRLGQKSCWCF
jgi:hypothetical protein